MGEIDWREFFRSPFFAGLLGVMFAVAKFMPGTSYLEKTVNLAMGSAIVWSCGPGAIEYFNIKSLGMACLMSFLIGALGLTLMAAIFSGIKEIKLGEIITGYFNRKG